MKIAENYKIWFLISLAIILVGGVFALTSGFNLGIDFTGGTMMQIELNETVPVDTVQELIEPFDLDAQVVHAGSEKSEIIIKTRQSLSNDQRLEIYEVFAAKYSAEFRGAEQFGPTIGEEIRSRAVWSILIASAFMLVYITLRFEFFYGVAAIVALLHDVFILLSLYAIFKIPVNSSFIAAILTIVGYSINDTIVVFDRVRENVRRMKRASRFEIANKSLSQTITRSINTSLTTLLVIGSLFFLTNESIREFALPLLVGVLAGTYSSIFIASPLWAYTMDFLEQRNRKYKTAK